MNCSHLDPRNYVDSPDQKRKGYIRTICRRCGKFIGYRKKQEAKK